MNRMLFKKLEIKNPDFFYQNSLIKGSEIANFLHVALHNNLEQICQEYL